MCNKLPFHNKPTIFNKFPVYNIHSDSHSGGILIEFAFSIPILIILFLFACDHYRFYELKDKIKTSAYLAASMLQQLTNTRVDKQLTSNDFKGVTVASGMNFFYGNSMCDPWPFGIYYVMDCFWVKRINNDSYQYQECWGSSLRGKDLSSIIGVCSKVSTIDSVTVKAMHADLICDKDGDERVLVECSYKKRSTSTFDKRQLGFFLLNPKTTAQPTTDGSTNVIFVYPLVITPKPGLFPGKS